MALAGMKSQFGNSGREWARHELGHHPLSWFGDICPFCPDNVLLEPQNNYFKHISKHLREISLTALPLLEEGEEDDTATNEIATHDRISESQDIQVQSAPNIEEYSSEIEDSHSDSVHLPHYSPQPESPATVSHSYRSDARKIEQFTEKRSVSSDHPFTYVWYCVRQFLPLIPYSSELTLIVSMRMWIRSNERRKRLYANGCMSELSSRVEWIL